MTTLKIFASSATLNNQLEICGNRRNLWTKNPARSLTRAQISGAASCPSSFRIFVFCILSVAALPLPVPLILLLDHVVSNDWRAFVAFVPFTTSCFAFLLVAALPLKLWGESSRIKMPARNSNGFRINHRL